MNKTRIAVLGSTGSIGTQALDVIAAHSDIYQVEVLTANSNIALLSEQVRRFRPNTVVVADETKYVELSDMLQNEPVKVYAGAKAVCEAAAMDVVDTVLVAIVGFAGLQPTVSAIKAHKKIALANKETLVVAGEFVTCLAEENGAFIIPVDSEHSAIFQCLAGEMGNTIDKILLTASGGPFRKYTSEELSRVTIEQALRHPKWNMGAKITVDSATMMNKGFEVIEARWLFGVKPDKIQVLIHPQSIVHSAVQFADGAVKAQLGMPDMHIPIQYALSYPKRFPTNVKKLDLSQVGNLTFEEPDTKRFPCLALAYDAIAQGGNIPCALNAADEVANKAFREGQIKFTDINEIITDIIQKMSLVISPTLDCLIATDNEARIKTNEIINRKY